MSICCSPLGGDTENHLPPSNLLLTSFVSLLFGLFPDLSNLSILTGPPLISVYLQNISNISPPTFSFPLHSWPTSFHHQVSSSAFLIQDEILCSDLLDHFSCSCSNIWQNLLISLEVTQHSSFFQLLGSSSYSSHISNESINLQLMFWSKRERGPKWLQFLLIYGCLYILELVLKHVLFVFLS